MADDAATRRTRLDALTCRWRARHEARRAALTERPRADPARQSRAAAAFPHRSMRPAAYAAAHGNAMAGFTYDAYAYDDPHLDGWLVELGRLLRSRR